jgi:hypothetical protein
MVDARALVISALIFTIFCLAWLVLEIFLAIFTLFSSSCGLDKIKESISVKLSAKEFV